ncbi:MAG: hypothetical protein ACT4PI_13775 [Actinomycetota bacterium]
MDLADHFRLIQSRAVVILLVASTGAAVVFAISRSRDPVYAADARVDVIPDATRSGATITQEEVDILTRRYAAFVETNAVLRDGAERAGVDVGVGTLKERVSTRETDSPGFLEIRATASSPPEAKALVAGLVHGLISAAADDDNVVRVVAGASARREPVSPQPWRDALFAFLLTLVATAELSVLVGAFSGRFSTVRDRREVERMAAAPVLGVVPLRRRHTAVDAFHELRGRIDIACADADVRSVAVVGATRGSGASYVARGFAGAAAAFGQSVVLVDANLSDPSVAERLGIATEPGLGDAARTGSFDLSMLQPARTGPSTLRLVGAGARIGPAWQLGSGVLAKVLAQISDTDLIVVDAPAITDGRGAATVAIQCDAVVLVVDARRSRRRSVADAAERLHQVRAPVIGCVVNRAKSGRGTRRTQRERRRDEDFPSHGLHLPTGASASDTPTAVSWRPHGSFREERG